ncbi:amino acid permease [Streptomyces angustmyceticus]|uniref:Amino acid permease n=1 Tax=Streptomyces angustmyceticus TaxID=285578 RepID=A0A5J4LD40_9ACTN|nr:amino acid permease [Streptomyces angustmyceticus]UAL66588.1 amino acid permease [Streptomyces angustmyceticus]GES28568.1 amino acid permease [Streptomyces angustmyceticus]
MSTQHGTPHEARRKRGMFRTKTVEQSILDTEEPEHSLKKSLSALDLTVFGVGVVIGTGIFVLTGKIAKEQAGPAVALSFVVAGVVCALAALCYAEFASTVPVAGSAYTFSYASLGELPAWIIGWDLILELALGCAVVAVGWSGYVRSLLDSAGVHLPAGLSGTHEGHFGFDLLATLLVLALTGILVLGMKLSSRVTALVVGVKVTVVLLVIVAGAFFITGANYTPFIPPSEPSRAGGGLAAPLSQLLFGFEPSNFGTMGIFAAAAVVFFAFIGFDIVATAAEETRNPQRDVPRGILGSLAICTVLYVAVSVVVTGMEKYSKLSTDAPLADAFKDLGHPFFADVISFGAAVGLTSVCMILLLGQSRVFFAMSRDGLLPRVFSRSHPRFGTPYRSTLALGGVVAVVSGFTSIDELAELVNIGTLFAFVVVAVGVVLLRRSRPDLPRSFRTPWVPVVPLLSVLASLWLMLNLPAETWVRFAIWMVVGFGVYFLYGRSHSRLGLRDRQGDGKD